MPLFSFEGLRPRIHPSAFVAPTATLVGDVIVEEHASIWYGVVIRADYAPVIVNEGLTLNFEVTQPFEARHYAFRMAPEEWQRVKDRLTADAIPFGDSTRTSDGSVYERGGLRGFFFKDPNGHSVEIITHE